MLSLDNTLKYISLGGFFMIFASSLKLTLYYSFFGINIGEYIQLNEYIVQFIYDLYFYILIFGFAIVLRIYSETQYPSKKLSQKRLETLEKFKTLKERAREINHPEIVDKIEANEKDLQLEELNLKAVIVIVSVAIIGVGISIFYPSLELSERYGLLFILFALVVLFLSIWLSNTKYEINYSYFIAVLLLTAMLSSSIIEPLEIKENKTKREVSLSFNNGNELMSTCKLKYIGKTEKYVFFYDLETSKNIIYSLEGVKRIETKKVKNYNINYLK